MYVGITDGTVDGTLLGNSDQEELGNTESRIEGACVGEELGW